MARLIDADALIADMSERYCKPCKANGEDHHEVRCRACWVDDAIDDIDDFGDNAIEPKQANDLVSRADAIKAICEDGTWLERQGCYEITMAERKQRDADILSGIPSAQPKQGEWVKRTHYILIAQVNFAYCSECGQPIMHEHTRPLWSFCPNCGARMKGADDE